MRPTLKYFGDKPECSCCGSVTPDLQVYGMMGGSELRNNALAKNEPPYIVLCDICANTPIGNWHQFMDLYGNEQAQLGRTLAYIGNKILAAIKDERTKRGQ